jgi:hypothetical protein
MPFPWRTRAVPLPCHAMPLRVYIVVFPIRFTQCGCVWFTHAMPRLYHAMTMPFWERLIKATVECGMGMAFGNYELALAIQRWHVGDLPVSGFLGLSHGHSQRPQNFRKMAGAWHGMCDVAYRNPSSLSGQSEICGGWNGSMTGFYAVSISLPLLYALSLSVCSFYLKEMLA